MAETPKSKKEPKKKPKWPLFAVGALAAGAGWYALTGEKLKTSDQPEKRTDKISETTSVDNIKSKIRKKLSDQLTRAEDDEVLELIREMRKGDTLAAILLIRYIGSVAEKINSTTQEADIETACRANGLSKEEYFAAENALRLKRELEFLEISFSLSGGFPSDEKAIEKTILNIIQTLSGIKDPFHPLLLRLLDMKAQDLKDRIQEIIAMSQRTTGQFEPHIVDQIRNEVKRIYGIP